MQWSSNDQDQDGERATSQQQQHTSLSYSALRALRAADPQLSYASSAREMLVVAWERSAGCTFPIVSPS